MHMEIIVLTIKIHVNTPNFGTILIFYLKIILVIPIFIDEILKHKEGMQPA